MDNLSYISPVRPSFPPWWHSFFSLILAPSRHKSVLSRRGMSAGVRSRGNGIITPFVVLPFHALHSHLNRPDLFIWHCSTPEGPQATCSTWASYLHSHLALFTCVFQTCRGMFLVAVGSLHVFSADGSEHWALKLFRIWLCHTSDGFSGLAAVITTSAHGCV